MKILVNILNVLIVEINKIINIRLVKCQQDIILVHNNSNGGLKMKKTTYEVVSFWELEPQWQTEARSNLNEYAEENNYLQPLETDDPKINCLWDLSTCMPVENEEYNAVISISNNSALACKFNDDMTEVETWII